MNLVSYILWIFFICNCLGTYKTRNITSYIHKNFWHKHLPAKIFVLLWKISHNALPTDLSIQRKGVRLASKCSCCMLEPHMEFNNCLFLQSEIAQSVWQIFAENMDISADGATINHQLTLWWQKSKGNTLQSWLLYILPCFIL